MPIWRVNKIRKLIWCPQIRPDLVKSAGGGKDNEEPSKNDARRSEQAEIHQKSPERIDRPKPDHLDIG